MTRRNSALWGQGKAGYGGPRGAKVNSKGKAGGKSLHTAFYRMPIYRAHVEAVITASEHTLEDTFPFTKGKPLSFLLVLTPGQLFILKDMLA